MAISVTRAGLFDWKNCVHEDWTCVGSSDGITAALDGVDRTGVIYDPNTWIGALAGTAHTWIAYRHYAIIDETNTCSYLILDLSGVDSFTIYWSDSLVAATVLPDGTIFNAPILTEPGLTVVVDTS